MNDGEMIETLMRLNGSLNGLFMLGDSLFDYDTQPLAGLFLLAMWMAEA